MPKQLQILDIDPKNDIYFKGPYTQTVTEYFRLLNPSSKRIAFKVKTTAPKRYCVRPNNGVINPGQTVSIAVMLQASDGTITDKNKHKFMIQSVEAPEGSFNHEDLFKSADPNSIMDSKFKCIFDEPNDEKGSSASRAPENNAGDKSEDETIKSSESNRFVSQSNVAKPSAPSLDSGLFSTATGTLNDGTGAIQFDKDFSGDEMNGHDNLQNDQQVKLHGSVTYRDVTKDDIPSSQPSSYSTTETQRGNTSSAYTRTSVHPSLSSSTSSGPSNVSSLPSSSPLPMSPTRNWSQLQQPSEYVSDLRLLVAVVLIAIFIGILIGRSSLF